MTMTREYILIVAEGCPGCGAAKARVKGDKRFRVLDVTKSNEAAAIALKLGIMAVPTVVEVDREANRICVLQDSKPKCVTYRGPELP